MSRLLMEFRDFLVKGNIVDLAVAFVMAVAFVAVVNSLVDNLLMAIIAAIIGEPSFDGLTFTLNDAVFKYGAFITDLIQFVAIGAAVFVFVVRPMQAALARFRSRRRRAFPTRSGGTRSSSPPFAASTAS